jgi:hypothetical protein
MTVRIQKESVKYLLLMSFDALLNQSNSWYDTIPLILIEFLQILDLRSQQVRDTCAFLTRLSIITKDLMRNFLRETFESIYTASKVPNKVMSNYVDDCIISLIRHTTFRSSIPLITTEARESRSKGVRERCMV